MIEQLWLHAIGVTVFVGALGWALWTQSYRWRVLAAAYPNRTPGRSLAVRPIESLVASGAGHGWSSYHGVRIEVAEEGLHLRLFPLFAAFSPPLFLPFAEMSTRRTRWYLNTGSFAISMQGAPGLDLIVSEDVLAWIRDHAGDRLSG